MSKEMALLRMMNRRYLTRFQALTYLAFTPSLA